MGFYRERVLPRVVDRVCAMGEAARLRAEVCAGLHGEVVELGFGSGLNVPHYPAAVTRVAAVEPADLAWRLAAERVAASHVPVERAGLDGQSLPFDDAAFDAALFTWTMCTVPDPGRALAELHRVLRPGGTVHFVEHGLAPDSGVQRWQHRLEPLQKRVAGGCHLTREVLPLLTSAGFEVREAEAFYEKGAPRCLGADTSGVAVRP